ncbi:A/G-specific adenine glycosylase [Corynebacterium sp. sy017]|nr:A/G-specific adenine glycosylase [Corynebacterium sp. sy017]MBP3088578.1 A/G-specific adenine glycosylase [Corynebacterium sp. sy017]TSD92101.1 A/G-specific adenine glycosylase [Corynebacterium sp. SY003]
MENLHKILLEWFAQNARKIIWRTPHTSPWGILLSEVMSQQTPVARVEPLWQKWMHTWPTPAALATADNAQILRAWANLGYPRRALRLKECAQMIVEKHDGHVPQDVEQLLALPGIGDYTARAVAAFAFGHNVAVVDTNVRRVYARLIKGQFLAQGARKAELADMQQLLPEHNGPEFSVAFMELGALVCTPKPQCDQCPITAMCAWHRAGCPAPSEHELAQAKKRVQKFVGTDRQVRGKIMALLRESTQPVAKEHIDLVWPDSVQRERALNSLLDDGLAEKTPAGTFQLPH